MSSKHTFGLRNWALATAAVAAISSPAYAQASRSFNIPAQPLATALEAFGKQSGMEILFDRGQVAGRNSPRVSGSMAPSEALGRLTAGTGLSIRQANASTFVVSPGPQTAAAPAAAEPAQVSEVLVTGSNIRGAVPIGSQLLTFDERALTQSGRESVPEFLELIPQNFGATQAAISGGSGNFARQTTPNLRGLGNGTTLTLVNGRRIAASGDNGDLSDVSILPASMVERIEVLTDGASAIYGSDAIGGVVNIILKRHLEGGSTQLRISSADGDSQGLLASQAWGFNWSAGSLLVGLQYQQRDGLGARDRTFSANSDKRSFGGTDFRNTFANPGNILGPNFQPAFAIPRGQNGQNLTPAQFLPGQINFGDPLDGSQLLPDERNTSAVVYLRHDLTDRLTLNFDGRIGRRTVSARTGAATATLSVTSANPFYVNPTGGTGPLSINYSFIRDLGNVEFHSSTTSWAGALAAEYRLPGDWRAVASLSPAGELTHAEIRNNVNQSALTAALNDPNRATAFNPFGDGSNTSPATIDRIRSTIGHDTKSSVFDANIKADGSLVDLPAGVLKLALGADYRTESLRSSLSTRRSQRSIQAAFAELAVPILADAGGRPTLEASFAARYERYSDFGESVNPKVGVRVAPASWISFRASWGTSFRAPRLIDLDPVVNVQRAAVLPAVDPTAAGGTSTVLFRLGGNPDLKEETGTSWTAGADLAAPWIHPGLTGYATWFNVVYDNQVMRPGPTPVTDILRQEAIWAELINRHPSASELSAACALVTIGACTGAGPSVIADLRLRNIARLESEGLDFGLADREDLFEGQLNLAVNATYVARYRAQLTSTSLLNDRLATVGNPPKLRWRLVADWTRGPVTLNAALNYTGKLKDMSGGRTVSEWTTIDAGVEYRLTQGKTLTGTTLAIRAVNLLDKDPPFYNSGIGFDAANANPLGRVVNLSVTKEW